MKTKVFGRMILLGILTVVLVTGCFFPSPHLGKAWTFMLYLNGDESAMQEDYIAAFHDMIAQQVGSTDDVNIVIQFDRYPGREDFGGWEIAHRFYYTPGMEPTEENAIQDWGDGIGGREVNMADPDTLADFIAWAHTHYPAQRNALMVADHGYGWRGLLIDMTSDGVFMTTKEFAQALRSSKVPLDLLAINACHMQMIEVMYEIHDTGVEIVVGSEHQGTTWPIADIIKTLTDNPWIATEEWARAMVDQYHATHTQDAYITLSSIRLKQIPALVDAFSDLVVTMLGEDPFSEVQQKAQIVLDRLDEAVAYRKNGADWEDAGGLALYWPRPEAGGYIPHEFFYFYTEQTIRFAADSRWRRFLWVYYTPGSQDFPGNIPREIYDIRDGLQEFTPDPHIDLFQFCRAIVDLD